MGDANYNSEDEVFFGPITAREQQKSSFLSTPPRQRTAVYFPAISTPKSKVHIYEKKTPTGTLLFSMEAKEDAVTKGKNSSDNISFKQQMSPDAVHKQFSGNSILKPSRLFQNPHYSGFQSHTRTRSDSGFTSAGEADLSKDSPGTHIFQRSTSPLASARIQCNQLDRLCTKSATGAKENEENHSPSTGDLQSGQAETQHTLVSPHVKHPHDAVPAEHATEKENVVPKDVQQRKTLVKERRDVIVSRSSGPAYHHTPSKTSPSTMLQRNAKRGNPVLKSCVIYKDFPTMYGKQNAQLCHKSSSSEGHKSDGESPASIRTRKVASPSQPANAFASSEFTTVVNYKLTSLSPAGRCGRGYEFSVRAKEDDGSTSGSQKPSCDTSTHLTAVSDRTLRMKGQGCECEQVLSHQSYKQDSSNSYSTACAASHSSQGHDDGLPNCSSDSDTASLSSPNQAFSVAAQTFFEYPVTLNEASTLPLPAKCTFFDYPSTLSKGSPTLTLVATKPSEAIVKYFSPIPLDEGKRNLVEDLTDSAGDSRGVQEDFGTPATAVSASSAPWRGVQEDLGTPATAASPSSAPVLSVSVCGSSLTVISGRRLIECSPTVIKVTEQPQLVELLDGMQATQDWVTQAHTESNGITYHTLLDPASSPALMQEFPPEKEASKVRWRDQLAEVPQDISPPPGSRSLTARRSILTQRPPGHEFPFNLDPPTPIIITRRRRDLLVRPSINKLRRFMFFEYGMGKNENGGDINARSSCSETKSTAL